MNGLVALPLFLSLRAAIRAKVEASGAEQLESEGRNEARALSGLFVRRSKFSLSPPRLVPGVGGLSTMLKRARGRLLARWLGRYAWGAGWRRRAQAVAVEETAHLPASAYASEVGHASTAPADR